MTFLRTLAQKYSVSAKAKDWEKNCSDEDKATLEKLATKSINELTKKEHDLVKKVLLQMPRDSKRPSISSKDPIENLLGKCFNAYTTK